MTRTEPFTIASVAQTLGDLKKLPISDQALLLLKMLVHIEPQVRGMGGFSKHNLTMPDDSWGLAAGFPETENEAVRHHLLGVPWTRLVNEGFLVDPRGSGFFEVSEEGIAANIDKNKPEPVPDEKAPDGIPTAFISYSWDSDAHKDWVRTIAERLRSQGVRVILDQWELKAGGDRTHFMESNITASDFVIIICTPTYATKGNKRDGGVGYEAMIITSHLAQRILQNKFIPILRSGNFDDSAVPVWLQSKIGVDLRGNPYDEKQYDILLRTLHKAHDPAPPIGPKPVFSANTADIIDNAVSPILEQEGEYTTASLAIATNRGSDEPPQGPVAYAWYEMKGTHDRIQAYVRPAGTSGGLFTFETSAGERLFGHEAEIAERYLGFDRRMRHKGYVRMQTFNGHRNQSFYLP
jgi:TIR domain-containing protein